MKNPIIYFIAFLLTFGTFTQLQGQETQSSKISKVIKHDGTEFVGVILFQDAREVLIRTEEIGEVVIPKHEINKIEDGNASDYIKDKYVGENRFSTRYFYSSNGFDIKKGEHYAMLNLYGPEIHFAVTDGLSVGVMTSWLADPIIGSIKYSKSLHDNIHIGVGALVGTSLWGVLYRGQGILGYGSLTIGNRTANLTLSGGMTYVQGKILPDFGIDDTPVSAVSSPLLSVAGMVKVSKNLSMVGDSFIYTGGDQEVVVDGEILQENVPTTALIMLGLRYASNARNAFQFGFVSAVSDGEFYQVPLPMLTWFRSIN
ncbi:MAG: hypothetical protein AAFR61_25615 [Bacteroidota bacterium]